MRRYRAVRPLDEVLREIAERVVFELFDIDDEHHRWTLYLRGMDRIECHDQLLEAVGVEPEPDVALAIVIAMLERVPPVDRQRWVASLADARGRDRAARRASEWQILETRPLSPLLGDGQVDSWSDWLQLRLAGGSPEADVLRRLADEGRTGRIRRIAAERLSRI